MRKYPQNDAYVYSNMVLYVGTIILALGVPFEWGAEAVVIGGILGFGGMYGMKVNDNGKY